MFLKAQNFKCFVDSSIVLNNLTVFAGANGNGKSTAIQALLFLRQTIEDVFRVDSDYYLFQDCEINLNIPLNSRYLLNLGNSSLLLNRNSNSNEINLGLFDETNEFLVDYFVDNEAQNLYILAKKCHILENPNFPIFKREFYYLNAERFGPRISQNINHFDYLNTGYQGEYVAQVISEKGGLTSVEQNRLFDANVKGVFEKGLENQVNQWLNYIMPGTRIKASQNPTTLSSQIQIENYLTRGEPTSATNVGFGISYVLPIIVSGLIAKKDSFFIVENPEAHLHPSAQTRIGEFLSIIANSGVNVVIETHSDHLINGIQLAVVKSKILNDKVSINYFSSSESSLEPNHVPISINPKGELTDWPKGFFDQTQMDYSELFNFRSNAK